jgi:DNA replication and repair protein RecF
VKLDELDITNYRNITSAHFVPSPDLTVICGNNGQGKTNLLESVWLLTGGKSFRGSKDAELIKENEDYSVVEGVVSSADEISDIRIFIGGEASEKKGRSAKVNGVDYGRATSVAGKFTSVVFAPNHLSLVKGSPDGRRRFIDAALCQLYPSYITLYRRYMRQVAQKNALLKNLYKTPNALQLLDVYDDFLVEYGTQLCERRQTYLSSITPDIIKNYDDISSGSEQLSIEYVKSFDGDMQAALEATRKKDVYAGFCTVGPHRDDFEITINGKSAKSYASQGQQRSAVLSLKLAEAAGIQAVTGDHPVMLLDDVLSELDDARQEYLLTRMKNKQSIVTACDAGLFDKTDGKIYLMENGMLKNFN